MDIGPQISSCILSDERFLIVSFSYALQGCDNILQVWAGATWRSLEIADEGSLELVYFEQ